MEKNFSLYLTKIGLFDEDTSKNLTNSKNDSKIKSFIDTSFYYLMNFFDNLTESQKKYMSYFIPNNYKKLETNFREKKIKSLFVILFNNFISSLVLISSYLFNTF